MYLLFESLFIFVLFFSLPFCPLMSPSIPQSPHCCPCPGVLLLFCLIPLPPNLPTLSCHLLSTYESVSIFLVSLVCSWDATYEWNHMLLVFLCVLVMSTKRGVQLKYQGVLCLGRGFQSEYGGIFLPEVTGREPRRANTRSHCRAQLCARGTQTSLAILWACRGSPVAPRVSFSIASCMYNFCPTQR